MHSNIQIVFVVDNRGEDVAVVVERFKKILDRVMPGDEWMSAPRRLGGDDSTLYIDQWYAGDVTNNGGFLVGRHTLDGIFFYEDGRIP